MADISDRAVPINLEKNNIAGVVDPNYLSLVDVFTDNFDRGYELAGASFSVFKNGRLIVDLYGGVADVELQRPWTQHTTSVLFSTTKSITSIVLAHVLCENNIDYDEKIANIWPEFGRNGKEDITILDATLHRAGLPYTNTITRREDVLDNSIMSKYFENATPVVTPGTQTIYHALTYGLLLDQIVRRLDRKGRGVAQILDEEFVEKYGIEDLSIGLRSKEANETAAQLTELTDAEIMRQGKANKAALYRFLAGSNEHNHTLYLTFPWITTNDYNVLENRMLPMPSNMGISNARGLAHMHSLLATRKVLTNEFYELFKTPVLENDFDHNIGYEECKGHGWQYTKNPKDQWVFGHSGFGGQNVRVDLHNQLSYAYVCNGLKVADADLVEPWAALVGELYKLVDK